MQRYLFDQRLFDTVAQISDGSCPNVASFQRGAISCGFEVFPKTSFIRSIYLQATQERNLAGWDVKVC